MKTFAFIFARGGSKGIKNKNIVKINNKPLIYYPIKMAKKMTEIDEVYVSSDSNSILNIAKKLGAKIIVRPKNISNDKSPELLAWKHAVKFLKKQKISFDIFLSLPTTAPLRSIIDIKKILKSIKKKNVDYVITAKKSKNTPWFNMIKKKRNGYFKKVISTNRKFNTRQQVPLTFDMTTVGYASKPGYILKSNDMMKGNVKIVEIPEQRALDIDTLFDLKLAKLLIKQ